MGYFAVLGSSQDVTVVRCHLNLWVVGGLLGPRFYFDVGLGLRGAGQASGASRPSCSSIRLALPFMVLDDDVEDLSAPMLDSRTASLVFGQPVTITSQKEIEFSDRRKPTVSACAYPAAQKNLLSQKTKLRVLPASAHVAEADKRFSKNGVSVWTVEWTRPASPDEETYLRLRFRVGAFARAWTPQSSGALLDVRVCDFRESGVDSGWDALATQMLPLKELNMFAIVPARLKQRAASPAPKYVRLLEGTVWEPYLGRRAHLRAKKKLSIFYWRGEEVDETKPFRAFLDLEEDIGGPRWWTLLGVALVASFATSAVFLLASHPEALSATREWVVGRVYWVVGPLSVGMVWKGAKWAAGQWGALGKVAKALRRIEDFLYKAFAKT